MSIINDNNMERLGNTILKAASAIREYLAEVREQDDRIAQLIGVESNLIDNLNHLEARDALIGSRLLAIDNQSIVVLREVKRCSREPEGKTAELAGAFFSYMGALRMNLNKLREDLQAKRDVAIAIENLKQKQHQGQQEHKSIERELETIILKNVQRKGTRELSQILTAIEDLKQKHHQVQQEKMRIDREIEAIDSRDNQRQDTLELAWNIMTGAAEDWNEEVRSGAPGPASGGAH